MRDDLTSRVHQRDPNSTECCRGCRFWAEHSSGQGWCQRFPPVVAATGLDSVTFQFPNTVEDDWCGEFQSR